MARFIPFSIVLIAFSTQLFAQQKLVDEFKYEYLTVRYYEIADKPGTFLKRSYNSNDPKDGDPFTEVEVVIVDGEYKEFGHTYNQNGNITSSLTKVLGVPHAGFRTNRIDMLSTAFLGNRYYAVPILEISQPGLQNSLSTARLNTESKFLGSISENDCATFAVLQMDFIRNSGNCSSRFTSWWLPDLVFPTNEEYQKTRGMEFEMYFTPKPEAKDFSYPLVLSFANSQNHRIRIEFYASDRITLDIQSSDGISKVISYQQSGLINWGGVNAFKIMAANNGLFVIQLNKWIESSENLERLKAEGKYDMDTRTQGLRGRQNRISSFGDIDIHYVYLGMIDFMASTIGEDSQNTQSGMHYDQFDVVRKAALNLAIQNEEQYQYAGNPLKAFKTGEDEDTYIYTLEYKKGSGEEGLIHVYITLAKGDNSIIKVEVDKNGELINLSLDDIIDTIDQNESEYTANTFIYDFEDWEDWILHRNSSGYLEQKE